VEDAREGKTGGKKQAWDFSLGIEFQNFLSGSDAS
jgi:hypothetical protein